MSRGGKREGSGRPLKYGEKTILIQNYVPISKAFELKQLIKQKLKSYESKK